MDRALEILKAAPPDVMNHNLETAPRLYKEARPGSDYAFSLNLLKRFKEFAPDVPTKSGVMVGLGETDDEILQVMRDMRAHDIDMLTIGQYLAPSGHHLPVRRYVHPDTFRMFEREAAKMGFSHAAVGALVRSSYHADQQAHAAGVAVWSRSPAEPSLACGNCRADAAADAGGPLRPSRRARSLRRLRPGLVRFDRNGAADGSRVARPDRQDGALARAAPRDAAPRRACPRCSGGLKMVQQPVAVGPLLAAAVRAPPRRLPVVRPVPAGKGLAAADVAPRPDAPAARDRGRIDCVNCGAAVAPEDEFCSFCRSVPSLLDVARLARALDPAEAVGTHAVHAAPQRQAAIQCAACGAALPPGQTVACASCGATLAITSLAEVNDKVQALAPALRAAALRPPPHVVKRRLEALDADLPRRREWVARMEAESRGSDAAEPGFWLVLAVAAKDQPRPRGAARVRALVPVAVLALSAIAGRRRRCR